MKNNVHQNYTRWSIRRLSVGVASVVVASGFFILTSPVQSVLANEVAATPVSQTKPEKTQKDKQEDVNQLINKAVDTALAAPKETTSQSSNNKPAVENKVDAANTPKEVSENRAATPAETTPVTSPQQVKDSVANNIKPNTEVPASYLEKANVPGPFLAGVNQVIPYEAFGGDGMLTRLLLKSSENAPWSDNGTAKNPALLPLEGLTKGQYFYEVDLNGNTTGKEGQALLDQLRANGTQTYQATVKVYGNKDGKADLSNVVATKNISVALNGLTPAQKVNESVTNNIKAQTEVPASYLEKANVPGPFLAGVNQVIPYEAFGGDGMLTRLLLKSSENAPWSDNGTAKNPALLPLEGLTKGQYFYEVDLNGNTTGKEGQALLDQLRANGTQTYQATVKVYSNKDGKADLTNVVATKNISVTLNGLTPAQNVNESVTNNIKAQTEVPASYLEKANVPGPFLAGVNQVIPYEFFAGDGMLTRLLLKASDKAPWSDNGTAKNPALSPLGENVNTKGQYFYEVDLNGNTTGKEGQALLDQLRANGTQTYQATVKVYGNKDGKADLSNVIATREVRITLHKESMTTNQSSSTTNTTSAMKEEHARKDEMKPTTMEHSQQMNSKTMEQEKTKKEELSTPMMKQQKEEAKEMKNNDSMKKESKATLPVTGETTTNTSALGAFSAGLAFVLGILGLKAKKERI